MKPTKLTIEELESVYRKHIDKHSELYLHRYHHMVSAGSEVPAIELIQVLATRCDELFDQMVKLSMWQPVTGLPGGYVEAGHHRREALRKDNTIEIGTEARKYMREMMDMNQLYEDQEQNQLLRHFVQFAERLLGGPVDQHVPTRKGPDDMQ